MAVETLVEVGEKEILRGKERRRTYVENGEKRRGRRAREGRTKKRLEEGAGAANAAGEWKAKRTNERTHGIVYEEEEEEEGRTRARVFRAGRIRRRDATPRMQQLCQNGGTETRRDGKYFSP